MYPKAKPHEEAERQNKTRTPEEAAAALAEIEARRRQIAPEFARLRWTWPLGAISIIVGAVARDILTRYPLHPLILFPLSIALLAGILAYSRRRAAKRLLLATPPPVLKLVKTVNFSLLVLYFGTIFFVLLVFQWNYWTPAAIFTAVVMVITGPLVRRTITAMLSRDRAHG
ncbi:MAG: hypothetical protein DLM55_02545 [Acidimicrobiales bacterium]|nr:MAG: hypothetical protein DLM55_02545 [Acidimicrobiales bacterium]